MKPIEIVLVEDDAGFRRSLRTIIEPCPDLKVVGDCATAEEAISLIPRLKPDVVLMDLHLGKTNGIECTRRLKEISPNWKILILTIEESDGFLFRALKAGASGYVAKTAIEKVFESIRSVHRGEMPLSPSIARQILRFFQQAPGDSAGVEMLTPTERKVLALASKGLKHKEIAFELSLKLSTIESHLRHIYGKLGVTSKTEAVLKYVGWYGSPSAQEQV